MKWDNPILLHVDPYLILLCKNKEVIKLLFRMAFSTVIAVIEVRLSNFNLFCADAKGHRIFVILIKTHPSELFKLK